MKSNNTKGKLSATEQEALLLKRKKRTRLSIIVVAIILIGWLGFAIWDDSTGGFGEKEIATTRVNFDSIINYVDGLSED